MAHQHSSKKTQHSNFIFGAIWQLAQFIRNAMVALMCFYFVLVILQVLFRYVLNESLFWAEEVVRYSMIWSVMMGAALLAYENAHIRIDLIDHTFSQKWQSRIASFCDLLLISFCILLLVSGVKFVDRTILQKSASLDVPMWLVYGAIPLSALLHIIFVIARMSENRSLAHTKIPEEL